MRNGTHFSKLTPVGGSPVNNSQDEADAGASYDAHKPQPEQAFADETAQVQKTVAVLLSLSIACAAATLATGSYAAWLSRHQAARQALTDVNEILKSCQSRMSQLEADLQRLPNRQ